MRTGKWRDRSIAVGIVLGWHAVVGWWLLQRVPPRVGGSDAALQVVYVTLPPRHHAPVPLARHRAGPGRQRPLLPAGTDLAAEAATGMPASLATPAPAGSTSAVLAQALDMARRQGRPTFQADPLADRPVRIPKADTGRFQMRPPLTAAAVVAGIGKLVGGAGYTDDPCPEHRRNLANLLAAGDSPRLRIELEYDSKYCRP